jgi:hypothetical protein
MKLIHIPTNHILQFWDTVEPHLKRAESFGGNEYSIEQIKVYLTLGQWILVVAMEEDRTIHGAATLSFINYPNDRVAFITCLGGHALLNADVLEQLKALVKEAGATKIQGAVRESVARLAKQCGFYDRYQIVETKV